MLMGWLLHLQTLHFQREGSQAGWGPAPPTPLLAVPNVTAHPSRASVPTLLARCFCICILYLYLYCFLYLFYMVPPRIEFMTKLCDTRESLISCKAILPEVP